MPRRRGARVCARSAGAAKLEASTTPALAERASNVRRESPIVIFYSSSLFSYDIATIACCRCQRADRLWNVSQARQRIASGLQVDNFRVDLQQFAQSRGIAPAQSALCGDAEVRHELLGDFDALARTGNAAG